MLLAAGNSTRMGHNKLVHVIEDKALLQTAAEAALRSIAQSVIVVLGSNYEENTALLRKLNVDITINDNWEKGIGTSIKCGVKNLRENQPDIKAVIISVCDQPHLSSAVFDDLINTYNNSGKQIIASLYNSSFGVPVLYDKSLFNDLLSIPDEHGAKRYIIEKANKEMLGSVLFPKGDVDIDTEDDLKNLTLP